ncbi:hypothetical protein [Rhodococcus koreensis]|uniref:hypothetical protein n=1 Tax=Rhodococcus koreensis TaxID=99653 RepID=UPI00366D4D67
MSGSERVAMFDIDGGLADLSAFAHLLAVGDSGTSRRQAWQRFFEHVGQAVVVESGRDVVEAVAGLGFVVVYSTTRPVSCAGQTRLWLGERGFPPGRALLCRARGDHRAAVEVKAGHCRAVGSWLSGFVDDEPEIVDSLRTGGLPVHTFEELSDLGVRGLRTVLSTRRIGGRLDRGTSRPRHYSGTSHRRSSAGLRAAK